MTTSRLLLATLLLTCATTASAAEKKHVTRESDLPRFTYPVSGKLDEMVKDPVAFAKFAGAVRHDVESVLAEYEIDDKATERGLLGELATIDFLEGKYDAALARSNEVRALQEKPADKLLSGLQTRAMVAALKTGAPLNSPAYLAAVGKGVAAELAPMPYPVIENDIKSSKERAQLIGETLVLGRIREVLQPVADKSGALSSDLAPGIISARFALVAVLPLKQTMTETYTAYLAAHKVDKPDIWAARNVALPADGPGKPVTIAIWDSGVDIALFKDKLAGAPGKPEIIAFDKYSNPSSGNLMPIPAALQEKVPTLKARLKGFSDLQSNIESPEADEIQHFLSTLRQDQYKSTIEEISLAGDYVHGTHVAGIAVDGNPFARLVVARIEFGYTMLPDPCPSQALVERDARNAQTYVDFLKKNGVRVVNMSWGGSELDEEHDLEVCGIGKTTEERKALARTWFDIGKAALTKAMASAPEILFVAAAGNSNQDASFSESIPAGIELANLLVVGAVDKAGDEAPFTSYGKTVKVDANGYQVDSVIPGGSHLALSGTSMAAPEVTNLAAKILAVRPGLSPTDVVKLIVETSDKTEDGRRVLINPKKAVALAEKAA
jgi:hypothetical protein